MCYDTDGSRLPCYSAEFCDSAYEPDEPGVYPDCPLCGDPIDYCQGHGDNLAEPEEATRP